MKNTQNKAQFIGSQIKKARETKGISQLDLAKQLGFESATAISLIENGDRKVTAENLEKIANSFKGIAKSYALQAGRELRILVDPDSINDDEAILMARDMRKKIEEEMEYPGQIKIVVIREKRVIETAK